MGKERPALPEYGECLIALPVCPVLCRGAVGSFRASAFPLPSAELLSNGGPSSIRTGPVSCPKPRSGDYSLFCKPYRMRKPNELARCEGEKRVCLWNVLDSDSRFYDRTETIPRTTDRWPGQEPSILSFGGFFVSPLDFSPFARTP